MPLTTLTAVIRNKSFVKPTHSPVLDKDIPILSALDKCMSQRRLFCLEKALFWVALLHLYIRSLPLS